MRAIGRSRWCLANTGFLWLWWVLPACAGSRGTIGALLAQSRERRLYVREAPEGLAASRAGVQSGDEVLLIDGHAVDQMSSERVHRVLSGEVGEPVKLTLVREERILRVTLERTPVPLRFAPD